MKILNQAQAEAVYDAMCALNNVSGVAGRIQIGNIVVTSGREVVTVDDPVRDVTEAYENQAAFAAAYGLDGETEMVQYLGRKFKVLAKFSEALDVRAANTYMDANPNAAVLCVKRGIVYLADVSDMGVPA